MGSIFTEPSAAFKFFGGEHRVTNTIIYRKKIDFRLNGEGVFIKENTTVRDIPQK